MFLKNKNILIISPEAWGKAKLSKHHYATIAGQFNNKVWYLQPNKFQTTDTAQLPQHVQLVSDHFSPKGIGKLPKWLRRILFIRAMKKMESKTQVKFDIIWNFDNSRFFDLDIFTGKYTIHHCMDHHYRFHFEEACASSNICFGVTDGIVAAMKSLNANSYFIDHGFSECGRSDYLLPQVKENIISLFVGNFMRKDIQWEWLESVVKSMTSIHFYFVGSIGLSNLSNQVDSTIANNILQLRRHKNVTFVGELDQKDTWSAMLQTDILFASFDAQNKPDIFANLHKIMTYLATGKPIIINQILQYQNTTGLLHMANNSEEFIEYFRQLSDKNHASYSTEFINKRIAFAFNNTYEKQFERIDKLIQSSLT